MAISILRKTSRMLHERYLDHVPLGHDDAPSRCNADGGPSATTMRRDSSHQERNLLWGAVFCGHLDGTNQLIPWGFRAFMGVSCEITSAR
jgi:hypothetical protein